MSVFFGGASVLITFLACHTCKPLSFQVGIIYNVRPDPIAYWYSIPSQQVFDEMREMDEAGMLLEDILNYLDTKSEEAA